MGARTYSRIGKSIEKQDLRRDLDQAFQKMEAGSDPIDTPASLSAVDDTQLVSGVVRFVRCYRAFFELDRTSTIGLQADVILATKSGTGRWLRLSGTSSYWATQAVWHINFSTGSDQANGSSSGTAIKTLAEFRRRMRGTPLDGAIDVYFESTVTEDFDPTAIPTVGFGVVHYHGVRTLLASGTATTIQAYNHTTKADGQIVDSSKSSAFWTTYVGKLLVDTTKNAYGWVAKDLGSKTCRHSPLWSDGNFYYVDPAVSDAWAVYDLLQITGNVVAIGGGSATISDLSMGDFSIVAGTVTAHSCNITGTMQNHVGTSDFFGCRFGNNIFSFAETLYLDAFFADNCRLRPSNGSLTVFTLGLVQGASSAAQVQDGGVLEFNDNVAFFDFTATPITVSLGVMSSAYFTAQPFGTGSGYAYVMQIDGGNFMRLSASTVLPNITAGGSGYAFIGGTAKTQGNLSVSFLNPTNGAMVVYPQS